MKYIIVAVSGGPDSMALLDLLHKENYDIIVTHVNYNLRDNSKLEEQLVRDYCLENNIILEVCDDVTHDHGNFQAFARKARYDFMIKIAKKYNVEEVYVGHHQDDVIETYLMQQARDSIPTYYGISDVSKYKEITLRRPLLKFSKDDLIEYCKSHDIEYRIDESNLENSYTRNKIRNSVVSNMSDEARELLIKEINEKNLIHQREQYINENRLREFIKTRNISYFKTLDDDSIISILRLYFAQYDVYNKSRKEFENILNFVKSSHNGQYILNDDLMLYKDYGILSIEDKEVVEYCYTFDDIKTFKSDYFHITYSGTSFESVTVFEEDFPITIRNFKNGDTIKMNYGEKRISQFFIDEKIPQYDRKKWPIVINSRNEIILVPMLGCNVTHYSNIPNMFVVK